jgi:hypothetical protein
MERVVYLLSDSIPALCVRIFSNVITQNFRIKRGCCPHNINANSNATQYSEKKDKDA